MGRRDWGTILNKDIKILLKIGDLKKYNKLENLSKEKWGINIGFSADNNL